MTRKDFSYNIVITMMQKAVQIGNSVGVILPQGLREEIGIDAGDEIIVEREKNKITITTPKNKLAPDIDAKFAKMVDDFITEHEDVLKELARR